jgi:hypothetical protein
MRVFCAFCLLFLLLPETAGAQERVPKFKDFPVTEAFIGRNAPVILDRDGRTFRTRLRWAAKNERPNFAGHYILTTWGCGTTCFMGAVINAKTGKVFWLPGSYCCWNFQETDENFEPLIYRLDSKLIVISGMINEEEGTLGTHFYKFENGEFTLVHRVKK